jgi:alanyl-tRNA synthetase
MIPIEIERLREAAVEYKDIRIVAKVYENKNPKELKELVIAVTQSFPSIALLASENKLLISVSRGAPIDASRLAVVFVDKFGGKGGGSPVSAQIGGITPEKMPEFLEKFVEIVKMEISG